MALSRYEKAVLKTLLTKYDKSALTVAINKLIGKTVGN